MSRESYGENFNSERPAPSFPALGTTITALDRGNCIPGGSACFSSTPIL